MKKLIPLLLAVALLVGCGAPQETNAPFEKATSLDQIDLDAMSDEEVLKLAEAIAERYGVGESANDTANANTSQANKPSVGEFDEEAVIRNIEVTEYTWSTKYGNYVAYSLKNGSEFMIAPEISVLFKDESGATIGTSKDDCAAFEPGSEIAFVFNNDGKFASCEYQLNASEETYYSGVVSNLETKIDTTDEKVILTVTNNGSVPASFANYVILFMKDGKVVDYGSSYITDGDSEIKPGKTEFREESTRESFDSAQVFLFGRGDQ